ncbi:MAG: TldD/PmbA family protein, partial [Myxococcota bacterium]|nr:TldD/PmbA family protein [Myxococcota bacterium]
MSQQIDQILEQVLTLVKEKGASGDVLLSAESQLGLKTNGGELSEYKVTSSRTVGVRVVVGDQIGTSYSESTRAEDLTKMVSAAVENAGYAKQNPHEKIRAAEQTVPDWSAEICQEDETAQQAKIDLALSLESGLMNRGVDAKAPYNGFNELEHSLHFANTLGHRCAHRERQFSCYTYALLSQEDKQSMHLGYQVGRRFESLSAQACVTEAYDTALALLDGAPVESGQYDVVFNPECLNQLFSAFGMCWSGLAAMKELNPYRSRLGESIAHSEFTLTDLPYIKGGFAIRGFDGEGFARRETAIVREGHLESLLHNSVTASHFKIKNTANASRGTKGALAVAPAHLSISAGKQSVAETLAGTYLELISLQGVHSGAN